MKYRCVCGGSFANIKELRIHIALLTERWPAQRCTFAHFDPNNHQDIEAVNRPSEATQ